MIHVFCNKRGSGKTKDLIALANEKAINPKGDLVYINDNNRQLLEVNRKIRYIATDGYKLKNYEGFYGFVCGILSENYDIETVFIDGLSNMVKGDIEDAAHLFFDLEKLAHDNNIEFYINVNHEKDEMPEFIKKYVA